MSDTAGEPEPDEASKPEAPTRLGAFLYSLRQADPVSLAALMTAVVASVIGVMQTAFMWDARNDEVEAALRAQQLRACVTYRHAAVVFNGNAQIVALEEDDTPESEVDLTLLWDDYATALSELTYLLPTRNDAAFDVAEEQAYLALEAFQDGDRERLALIAMADGQWSRAHDRILDTCDAVIRDVRDR